MKLGGNNYKIKHMGKERRLQEGRLDTRIDVTEDARRTFDMFPLRQVADNNGDNDAENQENIANANDLEHQVLFSPSLNTTINKIINWISCLLAFLANKMLSFLPLSMFALHSFLCNELHDLSTYEVDNAFNRIQMGQDRYCCVLLLMSCTLFSMLLSVFIGVIQEMSWRPDSAIT